MSRRVSQRIAVVAAVTVTAVLSVIAPAYAAALTNVAWSTSQPHPGSTGARYTWSFTTATPATISTIEFTVPANTPVVALTPVDVYGVSVGTAVLAGTTVTFTVTTPAPIAAGVSILISIDGFTNTPTPGTYSSTVTTKVGGAAQDTAGSNNVDFNINTTAVTVVVARSTSFTNDTASFTMLMDPSIAALRNKTHVVTLTVGTNANSGYTLTTKVNQQLLGTTGRSFPAISAGIASAVASGAFATNGFGYAISGTGVGTVNAGMSGLKSAGYTLGGEAPFSSAGPTNLDTITITNQAKIDYLQSSDTYTGIITYTVTPSYI